MNYITARIRPDRVFHGYDADRKMMVDKMPNTTFVEKVIQIDRILSITAEYIFITCPHDTVQTWEYEGGFEAMKARLRSAGLMAE